MIWHSAPLQRVEQELGTNLQRGLTAQQAAERLAEHGPNRLKEKKKKSFLQRFVEQLKDFMVIILMIAAAVSCVTTILSNGEESWLEPIVIILIVIANALLGVFQESKAEAALDALKNMAAPSAKVVRDGVVSTIKASELVPGDVIVLDAGDYIPADARLCEAAALHCEESSLTGESVPVEKVVEGEISDIAGVGDRFNMVYAGCSVSSGRGRAVVCDTGMDTEIGKIATILESTSDSVTPLQIKLNQLGKTLGILALCICAFIFLFGMFFTNQELALNERFLKMFMTAVSLAVAAIPEGLAAIVTVVLAIGVQRMVKKNAIIRRLPAVETLGSATVICSDKTGTLTQNRMTLVKIFNGKEIVEVAEHGERRDVVSLLEMAAMCCDGRVEMVDGKAHHIGDPTETGIVAALMKYGKTDKAAIDSMYPRMGEIPFDSDRKLMTTINMIEGHPVAIVKGAPDILLSRCTAGNVEEAKKANMEMAGGALRVLGVAFKKLDDVPSNPTSEELEEGLTLAGLVGMIDPPREEAKEAIRLCQKAGIRTVMITGDHIVTATAIARQLGMLTEDSQAITGAELEQMSEEELDRLIEHIVVYARVSPADKIRIVEAWQKKGQVVAMTGDGVNDAPALKAADIGCAMGITGTDVAKGAAAMTLTDDNFATIVSAVGEGRSIFDNIRKSVQFLLSCNLGEVLTVFFAMIFWGESPLLAIQLLWINLITDGAPALALGMEPPAFDVMERAPRKKDESIFAHGLGINAVYQGVLISILTLVAYWLGSRHLAGGAVNIELGETMAFAVLALSQLFHSFNVRSNHSIFKVGLHTNLWMLGAFALSLGLMLLVLFVPFLREIFQLTTMTGGQWGMVFGLSVIPIVVVELVKLGTHIAEKIKKEKIIY